MFNLTPPHLETLHQKPSWLNRAGRIDRSACLELRCSDVWPSLSRRERVAASSRPGEGTPQRGARSRRRSPIPRTHKSSIINYKSSILLSLPRLLTLLSSRHPRLIAGDHRTKKSNALKHLPHRGKSAESSRSKIRRGGPGGGTQSHSSSRTLALHSTWSQSFTIERHRLHSMLAQHFFLCPSCGPSSPTTNLRVVGADHKLSISNHKFLKLFLVLPTHAELRDSKTALLWLQSLPHRGRVPASSPPGEGSPITRLIERYGILFPQRQFLCRHCLGLRYGEVKALPPAHRPHPGNPAYANFTSDHWQRLIALDNLRLSIANHRRRYKSELAAITRMMAKYE